MEDTPELIEDLDICLQCQMIHNRQNIARHFYRMKNSVTSPWFCPSSMMAPFLLDGNSSCWWSCGDRICGSVRMLDKTRTQEFNDFIRRNIYSPVIGYQSCAKWQEALLRSTGMLKSMARKFPCRFEIVDGDGDACPYFTEHMIMALNKEENDAKAE